MAVQTFETATPGTPGEGGRAPKATKPDRKNSPRKRIAAAVALTAVAAAGAWSAFAPKSGEDNNPSGPGHRDSTSIGGLEFGNAQELLRNNPAATEIVANVLGMDPADVLALQCVQQPQINRWGLDAGPICYQQEIRDNAGDPRIDTMYYSAGAPGEPRTAVGISVGRYDPLERPLIDSESALAAEAGFDILYSSDEQPRTRTIRYAPGDVAVYQEMGGAGTYMIIETGNVSTTRNPYSEEPDGGVAYLIVTPDQGNAAPLLADAFVHPSAR